MTKLLALYVLALAHEPCLADAWRFGLPVMPAVTDGTYSPARYRWNEAVTQEQLVRNEHRTWEYDSARRSERTWNYLDDFVDTRRTERQRMEAARELRDCWLGPVAYYCGMVP